MLANVTCPACQHKFWLQEGDMGSRQTCPNCQTSFFAGASVAEARAAAPAAAAATGPAALQAGYAKTMIGDAAPPIKYNCPRCKGPLEATASEAGTKKNCPNCTQRHQVPAQSKPEPVVAASPTLNKTMLAGDESAAPPRPPIKYNCPNPNCKKPLEAPAEQAGTKRNCPACNQRLQIPAAPPVASNRNKTMLAGDDSVTPANASQGVSSADGVRGTLPVVAGLPPAAASPWATALTPRNVALSIVVLLLLLLVVPALLHGGKFEDKEALVKAQMELEKLKAEIDMKKADMDRQAKGEAEVRRQIDEMMRNSRAQEEKQREEERQRLREIDDDDRRAALKRKVDQDQQQREKDRLDMEKKNQQMLEETQRKLDETKRALESSQQKQQTIINQPAPVVTYPPYNPYYYRPHWWW